MGMTFGVLGKGADVTTAERTLPHGAPPREPFPTGRSAASSCCPALAVLLLMVAYPFVSLLYYSTLRFSMLRPAQGPPSSIGLDNYERLLSDDAIWERFVFTGQFVFATVVRAVPRSASPSPIAFQRDFRGRDVLFTVAMLPMMLCPIIVGFLWRYMFNSEWGVVNYLADAARVRQDRLARRAEQRALGGRDRRCLDVDALRHPAGDRRLPRHPDRHQRGGRYRRRVAALPLLPRHAADVGADPADRLPAAPDRRLQAVSTCSSP